MYMEAKLETLLARFHELHPHIRVETIELPYVNTDTIRSFLEFGIVDVITLNLSDMFQLQESECLELLEQQQPNDQVYPFLNEMFRSPAGGVVAQPFIYSPVILCYNKEHFQEKCLFEPDSSWHWNDLLQLLREIKAPNRYAIAFQLFSMNRWPIFVLQQKAYSSGSPICIPSLADLVRDAAELEKKYDLLDGLNWVRELIHEDGLFPLVLAQGEMDAELLFKQQKVSVILTTYYMLNELADVSFQYDITQLPHFDNGNTFVLSTGIAVNAVSKRKEAAQCLSDYLTSKEIQTYLRQNSYSLPANRYVTETVQVELPIKPSRLELHREYASKYVTHRHSGMSIQQIISMTEDLKHFFLHLLDERELLSRIGR